MADLAGANTAGRAWFVEVNAQVHSETAAVPAARLITEQGVLGSLPSLRAQIGKIVIRKVDRLSCVRFGPARYSVPNEHVAAAVELRVRDGVLTVVHLGEIIAEHLVVAPGEISVLDEHYWRSATRSARAIRLKSPTETAFARSARPLRRSSKAPPPTEWPVWPATRPPSHHSKPYTAGRRSSPRSSGPWPSAGSGRRRDLHPRLQARAAPTDPARRRAHRQPAHS